MFMGLLDKINLKNHCKLFYKCFTKKNRVKHGFLVYLFSCAPTLCKGKSFLT